MNETHGVHVARLEDANLFLIGVLDGKDGVEEARLLPNAAHIVAAAIVDFNALPEDSERPIHHEDRGTTLVGLQCMLEE
jgi:hypothetical protein